MNQYLGGVSQGRLETHRDEVHLQGLPDRCPLYNLVSEVEHEENRDVDVYQYTIMSDSPHTRCKSTMYTYKLSRTWQR